MQNNIKSIRTDRGISAVMLAKQIQPETSFATILRLENGEVSLTLEWMEKLAKALKCEPWELSPTEWHSQRIDQERLKKIFIAVDSWLENKKKGRYSADTKFEVALKLYNAGIGKFDSIQLEGKEFETALKLAANG